MINRLDYIEMIDFYTYGTINGKAVAIALELMGLKYRTHLIDLTQGEQRLPEFLAINPSGRIPVIRDEVDGESILLSQTGAILIHLAEKTKQLLSRDAVIRAHTFQWMQFILTDIGTNVFNNFHLKALVSPQQPEAGEMLKQRAIKFCYEIDQQLDGNRYIVGEQLSLADVVAFPVIQQLKDDLLKGRCPNISIWYGMLSENKTIAKCMRIGL